MDIEGGELYFSGRRMVLPSFSLSTATWAIQKVQIVLTHPLYECVEVAMVAV